MPEASMRRRKARTSAGSNGRPFHWLAFLLKICSASQPCTTARSTALATPPATDMCAPIFMESQTSAPHRRRRELLFRHYNRRMRPTVCCLALVVLLGVPAPVLAWGYEAHKFIMDRAIALLPAELRPLFEANRTTLVERAI